MRKKLEYPPPGVYIYLLNVPSFSSRYFNKIKQASRLGRLLALSLEILSSSDIVGRVEGAHMKDCLQVHFKTVYLHYYGEM